MKNRYINKSGFTLIEVMVTLALLSILIVVASNFFLFNNKVYNKSDNISQVQFDVRMAADYVATTVRNVESISTTDEASDFIDIELLKGKYMSVNVVKFEIKSQDKSYLLGFVIQGSDSQGESLYSLESEILLNNITSATSSNGSIIYFTK